MSYYLEDDFCLESLFEFKLTPELMWNTYIRIIAKYAEKMVGFL